MSSRLQERTDSFKQQLLTAQRRHLIGHLETTISGYEEQIDRQQKLLDAILQPEVKVRGAAVFPADVQQLLVIKDEGLPEQQEWSRHQFQDLKDLFKQQLLTAPREDLIGHFETTISRYQKEIDRQQKLLDVILQPEIKLRRAVVPADFQQLLVIKAEVPPEQQEWSTNVDQENPKPQHIKEEQEEKDVTKFTFTPVPVKSEDDDDEEKPQTSLLHQRQIDQMETGADGGDCGARNFNPGSHLQMATHDGMSDLSEAETDDSGDWEEIREGQKGLNPVHNNEVPVRNVGCVTGKTSFRTDTHLQPDTDDSDFWKETRQHQSGFTYRRNKTASVNDRCNISKEPFSCSDAVAKTEPSTDDKQTRQHQSDLNHLKHEDKKPLSSCEHHTRSEESHNLCHTEEKPFRCFFCGQRFASGGHLSRHLLVHVGERCVVCNRTFTLESELMSHECVPESSLLYTANKSFSCSHCGKRFEHKHHLKAHMRTHTGEEPFGCSVCLKTFARRETLSLHMTCHTAEKPFHCSVCNTGFINSESLIQHMRVHTRQTQFSCSICGKEFAWRRHLTTHMEVHVKEGLYRCGVCDRGFTQKYQLDYHRCVGRNSSQLHQSPTEKNREPQTSSSAEQMKTDAGGEDCGGPEPEPAKNSHPDKHLQFSSDDKTSDSSETDGSDGDWEENKEPPSSPPHQPKTEQMETEADGEDCGGPELARNSDPDSHLIPDTEDKTEDRFEREIQVSNDDENAREAYSGPNIQNNDGYNSCEKLFICSVCGKQFKQNANLKTHMRTHTGEKPFSCSVCSKQFAQKRTLQNHFRCHTGENPFRCSFCGKKFKQNSNLKRHIAGKHTGEKPYSCSFCEKCFSRSEHVQLHMRSHTGEKPYSCSVCGKSFTQKRTLQNHVGCCKRENPLNCTFCGKKFKQHSNLKRHIAGKHTGEKPYSCSLCDKSFVDCKYLQLHMRTHTGEKPFSCKLCNKRFTWSSQVKNHKCCAESSQLQGLDEADITLIPVPVKSEEDDDDEEKPQPSQLHQGQTEQIKTEADGEDCGGPDPARNSHPDTHLTPDTDDSVDSDFWKETRERPSGLNYKL